MHPIKSISIPTPCHEDWQQMTTVDSGRHCQSCCKTVIDFTAMSNTDVVAYLASNKNTCGRVDVQKLAAINNQLDQQNRKEFSWKGLLAAASLSMLFPAIKADAQPRPKTEQTPVQPAILGKLVSLDTMRYITIKGVVIAKDDGLPVPGASVNVLGRDSIVTTDLKGKFQLEAKMGDTVSVKFIGYETQKILIATDTLNYNVELIDSKPLTGVVMAGMFITKRAPFYKRWWYKTKRLF